MSKWTTTDIPDQTGRTAVITGANTGLGYETAAALAAKGAHVVLAVRNIDKGNDAAARISRRRPRRQRRGAGARPHVAGLRPRGRRRAAVQARHHRPADQQRRRDVHAEGDDQGRLRIAVRHQPSGPLRVHRPAARPRAGGTRFARRDGQQRRASLRAQRNPLRRPPVGEGLQPGRRLRTGQAGQPDVHLRAAATPAGHRHHRRRRTPRRIADRTDPQPAAAHRCR